MHMLFWNKSTTVCFNIASKLFSSRYEFGFAWYAVAGFKASKADGRELCKTAVISCGKT